MRLFVFLIASQSLIFANVQNFDTKIYIAGHNGLVRTVFVSRLKEKGFQNILTRDSSELDLSHQKATKAFFEKKQLIDIKQKDKIHEKYTTIIDFVHKFTRKHQLYTFP